MTTPPARNSFRAPSGSVGIGAVDEDLWFDAGGGPEAEEKAAKSMAAMAGRILGAKPLPLAARRLADLTRNADARIEQTVRVLESDPALSARLLRLVNSAGYALRMRCASVHHAAALVGTRRLHQVATTVAVMDLFDAGNEIANRLLEHATIVGALCRYLAVHLGLPRDELFTCGFLHDIGQLMLLDSDADTFGEVFAAAGDRVDELHIHERRQFGFDHSVLAAHVLTAWNIPEPIPRVVAWHHTPSRAYASGGMVGAMVAALRLADQLSHALTEENVGEAIQRVARGDAASYLDVSEGQLSAMWKELQSLQGQSSERSSGADVAEADILPRHDIRPSNSPRAPSSRVNQAPMHFPCVVCQKPSYGNVCPCCEGYVCPTHQVGRDEWCTMCTHEYRGSLEDSALRPIDKAALGLGGIALAASAAAGAAATAPGAVANLVVGPALSLLLAGTVFTVGRSSYLRARFVKRRRSIGLAAPSAPTDDPVIVEPLEHAPRGLPASPFEARLDAMLATGGPVLPLTDSTAPTLLALPLSAPVTTPEEDLGVFASTVAPQSRSPEVVTSQRPASDRSSLPSAQTTQMGLQPIEALRPDDLDAARPTPGDEESSTVPPSGTLPVTSGRGADLPSEVLKPELQDPVLEAIRIVRLESAADALMAASSTLQMAEVDDAGVVEAHASSVPQAEDAVAEAHSSEPTRADDRHGNWQPELSNTAGSGGRRRCFEQQSVWHACVTSHGVASLVAEEPEPTREGTPVEMVQVQSPALAPPEARPSIPFTDALSSIVVTVAPSPAQSAEPARAEPSVAPPGTRSRAYGGALSIPPNAFDDEPEADRAARRSQSGRAGDATAARRARYG